MMTSVLFARVLAYFSRYEVRSYSFNVQTGSRAIMKLNLQHLLDDAFLLIVAIQRIRDFARFLFHWPL